MVSLVNMPFPRTLRSTQSYLGGLNYNSRFIEDFAIYASVLYELREADFHGISRMEKMESPTPKEKRVEDRKGRGDSDPDRIDVTGGDPIADDRKGHGDSDPDRIGVIEGDPYFSWVTGGDINSTDRSRWGKAKISLTMLKDKIAKTPILNHFYPDRPPVTVVYAIFGAVSAALLQEHDGIYWSVVFTSRTLKPNEINYGMVK